MTKFHLWPLALLGAAVVLILLWLSSRSDDPPVPHILSTVDIATAAPVAAPPGPGLMQLQADLPLPDAAATTVRQSASTATPRSAPADPPPPATRPG